MFSSSREFNLSIGLGWNIFQIRLTNVASGIRPVVYTLRIHRNHRISNSRPFPSNYSGQPSVCILRQVHLMSTNYVDAEHILKIFLELRFFLFL